MTDLQAFNQYMANCHFQHFMPDELLVKVGAKRRGIINQFPPEILWPNIVPTIRVLDQLRDMLGAAIIITSCYRSPEYNATIPGSAKNSYHSQFMAADFHCKRGSPALWSETLKRLRNEGLFDGGIGVYPGFVHVDTRGRNATWYGR